MNKIKKLIDKYLNRNKNFLSSKKIIHQMNAVVLTNTSLANFKLNQTGFKEVKNYCKENGYDVDKVILFTCFDAEMKNENKRIQFDSDSIIIIIKKRNKLIAGVFMGSWGKSE